MAKIINKQNISKSLRRVDITAPEIVAAIRPGQFVMIRPDENCDKIPLSVVEWDNNRRSLAFIFEVEGEDTKAFEELPINEEIYSILGPLGRPASIARVGTVVCIGHGIDVASLLPITRGFHHTQNKVIAIIGARTKSDLPVYPQMRVASKKIFASTEDGTFERRNNILNHLKDVLSQEKVDLVYACAPVPILESISQVTREKKIRTFVQLKPTMIDGTGFSGSDRVKVGNRYTLASLEGSEFNAHEVDFEDLKVRLNSFKGLEECLNPRQAPGQSQSESTISRKFLSAILRK